MQSQGPRMSDVSLFLVLLNMCQFVRPTFKTFKKTLFRLPSLCSPIAVQTLELVYGGTVWSVPDRSTLHWRSSKAPTAKKMQRRAQCYKAQRVRSAALSKS
eukprot:973775-Amphidinium_carterae.1